jgi:DNA-directed RNA polymerase specialized sigma24 family protein
MASYAGSPDNQAVVGPPEIDILALDQALERLRAQEERLSQVVELHYLGGLTRREIAAALAVSEATVDRDLYFARAWLRHHLESGWPASSRCRNHPIR